MQHASDLGHELVCTRQVRLVDDKDIGHFHHAGLHSLYIVACARHKNENRSVDLMPYCMLYLADAYSFKQNFVKSRCIHGHEQLRDVGRETV